MILTTECALVDIEEAPQQCHYGRWGDAWNDVIKKLSIENLL